MRASLVAHDVDESPGDHLFELAEGLLLEDRSHLAHSCGAAFPQDEIAHRSETRSRGLLPLLIERLMMFERGQARQFLTRQTELAAHLLVQIGAIGEGRELLPPQELRDVRLGHLGSVGQVSLAEAKLFQPLSNDEGEVHCLTKIDYTLLNLRLA